MKKFYLMENGSIALQDGKPLLLTEEEFQNCCCPLDPDYEDPDEPEDPETPPEYPEDELVIIYDWSYTSMEDLDTCTEVFNGTSNFQRVGWPIDYETEYLDLVTGDNTGRSSYEKIIFKSAESLNAGIWSGSTTVTCKAGWYVPAGGSGRARLIVRYLGETQNIWIYPGEQNNLAGVIVATLTVTPTEVIIN